MDTQDQSRVTAPCTEENSSPNPVNGALAHNTDDTYPQPLGSAALHGIAGDIVQLIEPHTEADPVAVLLQFLVAFFIFIFISLIPVANEMFLAVFFWGVFFL